MKTEININEFLTAIWASRSTLEQFESRLCIINCFCCIILCDKRLNASWSLRRFLFVGKWFSVELVVDCESLTTPYKVIF